jgi:hypothetical protein
MRLKTVAILSGFALAGLVLGLIGNGSFAADPNPGTQAQSSRTNGIQQAITAQLESFNKDDAAGAFAHASPGIKRQFGSPERFAAMVARGYPQLFKSRSAEFLELGPVHGKMMQRVRVVGEDGRVVIAAYAMIEIDGRWLIDGCWLMKRPGTDV